MTHSHVKLVGSLYLLLKLWRKYKIELWTKERVSHKGVDTKKSLKVVDVQKKVLSVGFPSEQEKKEPSSKSEVGTHTEHKASH